MKKNLRCIGFKTLIKFIGTIKKCHDREALAKDFKKRHINPLNLR